jgi:hypothetical protein
MIRRWLAVALPTAAFVLVVAGTASAQDPASPSPSASATAAEPSLEVAPSQEVVPSPSGLFAAPSVAPTPTLFPGPPAPTPIVHPGDASTNTCYDCHLAVNDKQRAIAETWKASVHGAVGIGCADCHGGDPRSDQITVAMSAAAGFIGAPARDKTVGICGGCHSDVERMRAYNLPTDQYAKYWTSVHGQRLLSAQDTRVAICVDCHGVHDIAKASDPTSPVYPMNVPKLCASCHADVERMKPYGIPTDQYAIYQQSVHGQALLVNGDVRAPSCASCHGSHDAKPPRATEVVEVCGKCHTATEALYSQSRHSQLGVAAPKCWTCHGTHDVSVPGQRLFLHDAEAPYDCTTCHDPVTKTLRLELDQFKNEADRRCDTCHHPRSTIYSQVAGIADALSAAQAAYDGAASRIGDAARLGMIVTDADVALSEAKTNLIQAEAAVHTTKLTVIAPLASAAAGKASEAGTVAQGKIDESFFRREAMVVVVGLILLNVVVLYALKRRLDRQLKP